MVPTKGYITEELEPKETVDVVNFELSNNKVVFLDNMVFDKEFIEEADLKCSSICVTNQLIGG